MSDEMVMPTPDSPAGATDTGLREAFAGFLQEDAVPAATTDRALNVDATTQTDSDSFLENLLGGDTPGAVPYERFREVNERAKQAEQTSGELEAWRGVIDEFKQLGFNSAADIQQALLQQQQEAEESEIRQRYENLQAANILDSQSAYAQQEAEITKLRYERQLGQIQEYMLVQEMNEAMGQYKLASRAPELVTSLIQQGLAPTQAAEFVHNQVKALAQQLVPELTGRLQAQSPTPMGGGQSAGRAPQAPRQGSMSTLSQLLGITRNPNNL
jgi:hypothetical protein